MLAFYLFIHYPLIDLFIYDLNLVNYVMKILNCIHEMDWKPVTISVGTSDLQEK
jgi:hypothetical protein